MTSKQDEIAVLRAENERLRALLDRAGLGHDGRGPGTVASVTQVRRPRRSGGQQAADRLKLALNASAVVGLWDWDLEADLVFSDGNLARLYELDPDTGDRGAPFSEYVRNFHPEDRRGFRDALLRSREDGATFSQEYRIVRSDGSVRWMMARGGAVRDEAGNVGRMSGATIDITDRKLAEMRQAALLEAGDRFRDINDPGSMAFVAAEILGRTLSLTRSGYGTADPDGLCVTVEQDWTSPGVKSIAGRHSFSNYGTIGDDLLRGEIVIIDDVQHDPRTAKAARAFAKLNIRSLINVPVMEHGRFVALLFLHDSNVRHWSPDKLAFIRDMAQRTRDAVERRRAEEHEKLLVHELQHRVKNTLAMIQSIASQTFRATESAQAREAFTARVVALSHANDLLTKAGWTAASMQDVVSGATIPHCAPAERFTISGPAIDVAARAALSLTLALHELCVNAAKYGALSNDAGHVTIDWEVAADATFKLRWAERGGPAVVKPTRTGFGTRLIQRSLGPELGADIRTDYDPVGLTFLFQVPLARVQDGAGEP